MHAKEADIMECMNRIILEKAVEAVLDAGVHPSELEGTKTAVVVASNNSDSQQTAFYKKTLKSQNFALTG